MYTQAEKMKENSISTKKQESLAVGYTVIQKQSNVNQRLGFVDNRQESLQLKKNIGIIQRERNSQFGTEKIDDNNWAISIGQKGTGDSHSALIIEGEVDHGNGDVEHWAQWADWIPSKVEEREATMEEMRSGTINGKVREKWEGKMIDIKTMELDKQYLDISAFNEFSKYQNTSTFQVSHTAGKEAQKEIANDLGNPPIYQWYGVGENAFNCASWVSKVVSKAGISIPSEETLYFKSLFAKGVSMGDTVHRPSVLVKNGKNLEKEIKR